MTEPEPLGCHPARPEGLVEDDQVLDGLLGGPDPPAGFIPTAWPVPRSKSRIASSMTRVTGRVAAGVTLPVEVLMSRPRPPSPGSRALDVVVRLELARLEDDLEVPRSRPQPAGSPPTPPLLPHKLLPPPPPPPPVPTRSTWSSTARRSSPATTGRLRGDRRGQGGCGGAHLKVILETGELETYDNVRRALDPGDGRRRRLHQDLDRQGDAGGDAAGDARHARGDPRLRAPTGRAGRHEAGRRDPRRPRRPSSTSSSCTRRSGRAG